MVPWFTGSRFWFTLKALLRGPFGVVNQDFCLISKNVGSDLRFSVGSLPPPYRGTPLVNQAVPTGGQGTQNPGSGMAAEVFCAGCGVVVLPAARRVKVPTTPWYRNGVRLEHDSYHPGCHAALLRREDPTAREHLAQARAALARPSGRRSA